MVLVTDSYSIWQRPSLTSVCYYVNIHLLNIIIKKIVNFTKQISGNHHHLHSSNWPLPDAESHIIIVK